MDYVIGCDIGSQSLKTLLLSAEGKICGEFSASYPIEYPQPTWAEQIPTAWIDALAKSIRSLLIQNDVSAKQIVALGLDAQVDGVVALDRKGQPVYPAMIWMDRRAVEQCDRVGEQISREIVLEITGLNLDPTHVAPKISWLANHRPDLFEKIGRASCRERV